MAMTEDLTVFLSDSEFSVIAVFSVGNTAITCDGNYDEGFSDGLGVEGFKPTFYCIESIVAEVKRKTRVAINGVNFSVAGKQPDGTGFTTIILEKV